MKTKYKLELSAYDIWDSFPDECREYIPSTYRFYKKRLSPMLSYPSYLINSHYTEDVRALLLGLVAIIAEPYKDKIKYYEKMLKIRKFMKNKDNGVFDAVIQRARTAKIKDLYSFVGLKKIKNGHVACCPLHNEKTPSFNMRDNVFYCFGCHRKGDSIQFIQDLYNVTFKKALSIITGINVR